MFVLGASVIAAAGIGSFLKGSISEAREAQQVGAQTNAVLKSTGGIANVSAKSVGLLATSLSNKIGVDDEAIQAGENMLLTFTNVRNEFGKGNQIFAEATKTVQDMAAAFGGDATSNSKILGKALNDPIKGISALTRVGVQFTDGQKDQIKTMVESGNIVGAQKIILGELSKQTKGSAEAQATAGMKAKVAWDNLKESVGTALLPVLDKLETVFVNRIVPALYSVAGGAKQLGGLVIRAFAGVIPVAAAFAAAIRDKVAAALPQIIAAAQAAFPVVVAFFGQLQTAAINLAPIVSSLVSEFLSFLPVVISIASTIASSLGPALVAVTGFLGQHATTVKAVVVAIVAMVTAYKIAQLATAAFAVVQGVLNAVLDANPIGILVLALVGLAAGLIYAYKHSETFRNIVNGAFAAIKAVVVPTITFIVNFVKSHWQLLLAIIGGPLGIIVGLVIKHFGTIKSVIGAVATFVVDSAKKYGAFARAVIDKVGDVVAFFKALPGKIKGFLASLPGDLVKIGGQIIEGLVRGIEGAAGRVASAVKAIVDKIPAKIRSIMGIASPSKVTTELGRFIGQGLADGIASKTGAVGDATKKLLDATKSKLDDLKSQFDSIKSSAAQAFGGDLFNVSDIAAQFNDEMGIQTAAATSAAQNFITGLLSGNSQLKSLIAAFKTLEGWGLKGQFLAQLLQSGNAPLILELASNKGEAKQASQLFTQNAGLASQLGTGVAQDVVGKKIDTTNDRLHSLEQAVKRIGQDTADALNGTKARKVRVA